MILSLLMAMLAAEPDDYRAAVAVRKPMVVVITASWCGVCPSTKKSVQVLAKKHGLLFAEVDYDRYRDLSLRIMSGRVVPETVFYSLVEPPIRVIGADPAKLARAAEECRRAAASKTQSR